MDFTAHKDQNQSVPPSPNKRDLARFLSYYRPYRGLFLLDMGCACLVAVMSILIPLGIRHITGTLLAGDAALVLARIGRWSFGLAALVVARAAVMYVVDYYGHSMGAMMERDLRRDVFGHLTSLSFSYFDAQRTGQLMSRLTQDTQDLAEFYHHVPEDWLIYALEFLGSLGILLALHPKLALVVMAFLPPMLLFTLYFNRRMNKIIGQSKQHLSDINAQAEDSLSGIRVAQSFTAEPQECAKFARENERFYRSRRGWYRSEALCYGGSDALTQLITIAVVGAGAAFIAGAQLTLPDMIAFLLYVGYLTQPLQKLMWMTQQFQMGLTSFERLQAIFDVKPDIQSPPDAPPLGRAQGEIELSGVCFRYGEGGRHVLQDVNLHLPKGSFVALVGSSGVGKTTLCSLIPRFYDVTQGRVLLDNVDVRDWALPELRRNIGFVQQDVYLFAGTVLENIRYAREDAGIDEVIRAAQDADAHDFIMALPGGYETDIGQRGVRLSGGQRQRIAIARAFLKNPPVLILDEATSALDSQSERAVQSAILRLRQGRTTLVIAHRLSTIKSADRIAVLTERGIEQLGPHAKLLLEDGPYRALFDAGFEISQ